MAPKIACYIGNHQVQDFCTNQKMSLAEARNQSYHIYTSWDDCDRAYLSYIPSLSELRELEDHNLDICRDVTDPRF